MNDRQKAEYGFNRQALTEAVERMKPDLVVASEAAHKVADLCYGDDDEGRDCDKVFELGLLAHTIACLCGPHLTLINAIIDALPMDHDDDGGKNE
jgi:hypothetical protein